jgi:hypothetical protein
VNDFSHVLMVIEIWAPWNVAFEFSRVACGCLEMSEYWEAGESKEAEGVFTLTCGQQDHQWACWWCWSGWVEWSWSDLIRTVTFCMEDFGYGRKNPMNKAGCC